VLWRFWASKEVEVKNSGPVLLHIFGCVRARKRLETPRANRPHLVNACLFLAQQPPELVQSAERPSEHWVTHGEDHGSSVRLFATKRSRQSGPSDGTPVPASAGALKQWICHLRIQPVPQVSKNGAPYRFHGISLYTRIAAEWSDWLQTA
jgi:hypothetical protein